MRPGITRTGRNQPDRDSQRVVVAVATVSSNSPSSAEPASHRVCLVGSYMGTGISSKISTEYAPVRSLRNG
jgi:hypothetical protein